MRREKTEQQRLREIELYKRNLDEDGKELYKLACEFWKTEAGKMAIKQAKWAKCN